MDKTEKLALNTLRMLGVDAINKANSGHPGIVLGAAPTIYGLYTKHLIVNPANPKWINRDRFVLSAGHGSALLYAINHLSRFNVDLVDLKISVKLETHQVILNIIMPMALMQLQDRLVKG